MKRRIADPSRGWKVVFRQQVGMPSPEGQRALLRHAARLIVDDWRRRRAERKAERLAAEADCEKGKG